MDPNSKIPASIPNQEQNDSKALSKKIFYKEDESAYATVYFNDGQLLKINKAMLCSIAKSEVLYKVFYGDLKKKIEIKDIDCDTFKLFLDLVMEYEEYNFEKAFKILPVAHKYQCQFVINQCIKFLEPKEINEELLKVLNMAVLFSPDCDELVTKINNFIVLNNVYEFLENERFCHLLEPDALKTLLTDLILDSPLMMVIINWGKNYIAKNRINKRLRNFFENHDLLNLFKLENFETSGAITDFCISDECKEVFSFHEVLLHIRNSETLVHGISRWQNMKQGNCITEEIVVKKIYNYHRNPLSVEIERNKAVFYNKQVNQKDEPHISCSIIFFAFNSSGQEIYTKQTTVKFSQFDYIIKLVNFPKDRNDNTYLGDLQKCHYKITWIFLQDCRVLLTNRPGDELNKDFHKMYFIKNVLDVEQNA